MLKGCAQVSIITACQTARTHSDWLTPEMILQGLELGLQENERTLLVYDITTRGIRFVIGKQIRWVQRLDFTLLSVFMQ